MGVTGVGLGGAIVGVGGCVGAGVAVTTITIGVAVAALFNYASAPPVPVVSVVVRPVAPPPQALDRSPQAKAPHATYNLLCPDKRGHQFTASPHYLLLMTSTLLHILVDLDYHADDGR